jgi:hypothetical protein
MERPTSTLGLAAHLVRTRWNALSARGRMMVTIGIAATAIAGAAGVHMATGSCCASECPMQAAAHSGCPNAHH